MKRLAAVIGLGLALGSAAVGATPAPAACVFCPTYPCFGNCGSCVCMRQGPSPGQCVTFRAVPEYERRGWSRYAP